MKKTPSVQLKCLVPSPLKSHLEALAAERGISLSALLRLILSEYIKQKG